MRFINTKNRVVPFIFTQPSFVTHQFNTLKAVRDELKAAKAAHAADLQMVSAVLEASHAAELERVRASHAAELERVCEAAFVKQKEFEGRCVEAVLETRDEMERIYRDETCVLRSQNKMLREILHSTPRAVDCPWEIDQISTPEVRSPKPSPTNVDCWDQDIEVISIDGPHVEVETIWI